MGINSNSQQLSLPVVEDPEQNTFIPASDGLLETLPEIYRKQVSMIDELRSDKVRLLDEVQALQNRGQEASKIMVERDKALEDIALISQELQSLKEQMGSEQATLRDGVGEVSNLKSEALSLNRQVAHLQSQLVQKDKAMLEMRRKSSLSSPPRLEENLRSKEEQLEGMSVELSELRAALNTSSLSVIDLTRERDSLETEVNQLKTELQDTKLLVDGLSSQLKNATESLATDTAKKSANEAKSRSQEETIISLEKELVGMTAKLEALVLSRQESEVSREKAESKYRDMEKRLNIAQRENAGMQLRLADLKSSLQHTHGENEVQGRRLSRSLRNPATQLPSQRHIGDEYSDSFLEIDLLPSPNNAPSHTIGPRHKSKGNGIPDNARNSHMYTAQTHSERQVLTNQIREELERWRGYTVNLVEVYNGYHDAYSRVFDI
ncbi:hypothetical protein TWF694_004824 [Orbilia ellipsospora]